ncbi:MAG: helix-turn-helix domain-containing protein [Nocardioidaceae bacterium]
MANEWGDVELDAKGMRALAHPVRLAILQRLREAGPATATSLAPDVGASPSVTSWHLRHLAEHGLVEDAPVESAGRRRWWQAVGRGFRFDGTTDAAAHRELSAALEKVEPDIVARWYAEVLPQLEDEWVTASGRWSTTILATTAELRELDEAIERLMTPLVRRKQTPAKAPEGSREVHVLRYTLPGPPQLRPEDPQR